MLSLQSRRKRAQAYALVNGMVAATPFHSAKAAIPVELGAMLEVRCTGTPVVFWLVARCMLPAACCVDVTQLPALAGGHALQVACHLMCCILCAVRFMLCAVMVHVAQCMSHRVCCHGVCCMVAAWQGLAVHSKLVCAVPRALSRSLSAAFAFPEAQPVVLCHLCVAEPSTSASADQLATAAADADAEVRAPKGEKKAKARKDAPPAKEKEKEKLKKSSSEKRSAKADASSRRSSLDAPACADRTPSGHCRAAWDRIPCRGPTVRAGRRSLAYAADVIVPSHQ